MTDSSQDQLRFARALNGPAANIGPGKHIVRQVSLSAQLAIYDSLPRDLRKLVDALPQKTDLKPVAELVRVYGPSWARDYIIAQMGKKYPGWSYRP
jgi:hypothetical protein